MTPKDAQVRQALTQAGHTSRPLDIADRREWAAEAKAEFMSQEGMKGCPSCNAEPTILTGRNRIQCTACPDEPSAGGDTLIDSLLSWNDDEDWQLMGAPVDKIKNRTLYPAPALIVSVRKQLTSEGY